MVVIVGYWQALWQMEEVCGGVRRCWSECRAAVQAVGLLGIIVGRQMEERNWWLEGRWMMKVRGGHCWASQPSGPASALEHDPNYFV